MKKNYALKYGYLGENVLPIGGWWGPYAPSEPGHPNFIDDKYYKLLKDAGINFISVTPDDFSVTPQAALASARLAHRHGMGFFMHDRFFMDEGNVPCFQERLKEYGCLPNIMGMHFQDEPQADDFARLSKLVAAYNTVAPKGAHAYVNMLPVYGGRNAGRFPYGEASLDYMEFLELFLSLVPVKFLSYDYYPFLKPDRGNCDMKDYYYNLSVARRLSYNRGIPFWVFVQTGGQWELIDKPSEAYYPSEGEFMWNVYSSLAYGAQGLQYFTLIQPESFSHTDSGSDFRRIGMIGCDGETNRWYDYVKRVNAQVAAIGPILMDAVWEGVIGAGVELAYSLDAADRPQYTAMPAELVADDALLGCFSFSGGRAYLAVNNDLGGERAIRLKFADDARYEVIIGGVSAHGQGRAAEVVLDGGNCAMIIERRKEV